MNLRQISSLRENNDIQILDSFFSTYTYTLSIYMVYKHVRLKNSSHIKGCLQDYKHGYL